MNYINLFILEDSDDAFDEIHKPNIDDFNGSNMEIQFEYNEYRARNIEQAIQILNNDIVFHSAIVDLKLADDTANSAKGNDLVRLITTKYRIPIFIYSNNVSMLDSDFEGKTNSVFKAYKKSDIPLINILNEIVSLYNTGIIDIIGKRGQIDEILQKVFWNHISHSLPHWINSSYEKDQTEKIILRHISEHFIKYLEMNDGADTFELYNSAEAYIMPPIGKYLFTGNIIAENDNPKYLVLSPACDMDLKIKHYGTGPKLERKAEFILLLELVGWNEIEGFSTITNSTSSSNKQVVKLKKMIGNSIPRFHFLPKFNSIDALFVDFQRMSTVNGIEIEEKIKKSDYSILASITSPFLKDIIARFSQYYSRQGSPDMDVDEIYNTIIN